VDEANQAAAPIAGSLVKGYLGSTWLESYARNRSVGKEKMSITSTAKWKHQGNRVVFQTECGSPIALKWGK